MPQLLFFLKVEDIPEGQTAIDWGTLLVFCCEKNCISSEKAYLEEFLARQNVSDKGALDLHKERAKAADRMQKINLKKQNNENYNPEDDDDNDDDDE